MSDLEDFEKWAERRRICFEKQMTEADAAGNETHAKAAARRAVEMAYVMGAIDAYRQRDDQ